jgi:hypothetical protein
LVVPLEGAGVGEFFFVYDFEGLVVDVQARFVGEGLWVGHGFGFASGESCDWIIACVGGCGFARGWKKMENWEEKGRARGLALLADLKFGHYKGEESIGWNFAGGSRAAAERLVIALGLGVKAGAGLPHSKKSVPMEGEEASKS